MAISNTTPNLAMGTDVTISGLVYRFLYGFSWVVSVGAFVVVLAGAHVTSTDSGDTVPTWPLPLTIGAPDGGVFLELGHRQIAGTVGVLTCLLFICVSLNRPRLPRSVWKLSIAAACLVALLALIGGFRVLVGADLGTAEHWAVTVFGVVHAVLGQTFFCLTACLVFLLGRCGPRAQQLSDKAALLQTALLQDNLSRGFRRSTFFVIGALYLQLLLGALLRFVRPGPVLVLVLIHIAGAVLVLFAVLELVFLVFRHRQKISALLNPARLVLGLLLLQVGLGFATFFAIRGDGLPASAETTWKTLLPTIHFGIGALLLMLACVMALLVSAQSDNRSMDPMAEIH